VPGRNYDACAIRGSTNRCPSDRGSSLFGAGPNHRPHLGGSGFLGSGPNHRAHLGGSGILGASAVGL
jgi:hypothetical protein